MPQATVWRAIDIQPQYVYFLPVEDEATNETKAVRIVSNLEEAVTLEDPHSSSPLFQAQLRTVRPGKDGLPVSKRHHERNQFLIDSGVFTGYAEATRARKRKLRDLLV